MNEIVGATSALLGMRHVITTTAKGTVAALAEALPAVVMASPRFSDAVNEAIEYEASVVFTPTVDELAGVQMNYPLAKGSSLRPFAESDLLDVLGAFALIGVGRRG